MSENVYFDWDSNFDLTIFKINVSDFDVKVSPEAEVVQERDGHADFELLVAMNMAVAKLEQEQLELKRSLSRSYPDDIVPELDA